MYNNQKTSRIINQVCEPFITTKKCCLRTPDTPTPWEIPNVANNAVERARTKFSYMPRTSWSNGDGKHRCVGSQEKDLESAIQPQQRYTDKRLGELGRELEWQLDVLGLPTKEEWHEGGTIFTVGNFMIAPWHIPKLVTVSCSEKVNLGTQHIPKLVTTSLGETIWYDMHALPYHPFTTHESPAATLSSPTGSPDLNTQADAPSQPSMVLDPTSSTDVLWHKPPSASATVMIPTNLGEISPSLTPDLDSNIVEVLAVLVQLRKYQELCSDKILKNQRPV
ncbi:uncharacterized protein EDB91DRAFT_1082103 [Suillus paluster]|uniref:uncharacterized protein n=1 Tax=Suillus paluster TaxID=48578 RepID=UPI001B86AAE6|nr:uncharacterized protein EDB91DRAFT_1082103 [Suillus paluster]KAG1740124.1 hypothetical protein EDB91DRAFT_1082103 [Suillus paluster]